MAELSGVALLDRLRALCEPHGRVLPGGDELLAAWGAREEVPRALRIRLCQALSIEWLRDVADPPTWALDAQMLAIEFCWQGLDAGARLQTGQMPAWMRGLVRAGQHELLAAQVPVLMQLPMDGPHHAQARLVLLRLLRQLKLIGPTLALLTLWQTALPLTEDQAVEVVSSLSMVVLVAEDLPELRRVADWLQALVPLLEAPSFNEAAWSRLGVPMMRLALNTLDLLSMQRLTAALLAAPAVPLAMEDVLGQTLQTLAAFAPEDARPLLDLAVQRMPAHPGVQMERVRMMRAGGSFAKDMIGVLPLLDPAHRMYVHCVRVLGEYCFQDSDLDDARRCYAKLQAVEGGLDAHAAMRLAHLELREADRDAEEAPPGTAQPLVDPSVQARAGALGPALIGLLELLSLPPRHDSPYTVDELLALGDRACADFAARLPTLPDVTVAQALVVAQELATLAQSGHLALSHWVGVFPYFIGPEYGAFDGERSHAMCAGVLKHLEALARFMVARPRTMLGGVRVVTVSQLIEILELGTRAALARGDVAQALADLDAAQAVLGTMGALCLDRWRECCLLTRGDIDAARALRATWTHRPPADVLPMREWDDWLRSEHLVEEVLVDDPELHGSFEVVQTDGLLRVAPHHCVAGRLSVVRTRGVRVRNSHLLIGPAGTVMLPHKWHLQIGEFPYRDASVLTRGGAGVALRPAEHWQRVGEPVAVLANMDAAYHRNYYHWVLQALTRVELLRQRGLLAGRRLLLPRELPKWMLSSLRDLGVPDEQWLLYGSGDRLELDDALVISALEFASETPNEVLRDRLWRVAGLDPAHPPVQDKLLFLSRVNANRRPLLQERQISDMARELGFEVVAPETLSLLDQVRLFARARGVVGPSGAALTNLMWTGDRVKMLYLFKEEVSATTFIDLALVRRQQFRWLQGSTVPGFERMTVVSSPFSLDLALVRRELAWVAEAPRSDKA